MELIQISVGRKTDLKMRPKRGGMCAGAKDSTIQELEGTVETLVETNKSLFSQLRALKASIGCMGGGGGSSKSSSASFSIMCLWFCVGASGDIFYWSH
eukprot:gene27250-9992_t